MSAKSKECPVTGMSELHQNMEDNPRLWQAGIIAGTAFAHYAMPDYIPCRSGRAVLKTVLNVGAAAALVHSDPSLREGLDEVQDNYTKVDDEAKPTIIAAFAAVTLASVGLTVATEKWLYRRIEKKKAAGKKASHTKQAIVLAALCGAAAYAVYDK